MHVGRQRRERTDQRVRTRRLEQRCAKSTDSGGCFRFFERDAHARREHIGRREDLRARGRSLPLDGVARGVLRLELLQHLRERWTHGVTREVVARLDRLL